jgi:type VI secretion system protein ImpA
MASPDLLDFAALTAPLDGETPAGQPVPFDLRRRFEEARKEVDPDQFGPDDPMRPEVRKEADWPGIVDLAQETLAGTSKDLMVAARLTEALVQTAGFAGLRAGLRLLRLLIADCWDRLFPDIEDGDLEVRATPFNWLDDSARLPGRQKRVGHPRGAGPGGTGDAPRRGRRAGR